MHNFKHNAIQFIALVCLLKQYWMEKSRDFMPTTGSSITERFKVSAFFEEKYFYFIETFDVILLTIEVHLVFLSLIFPKRNGKL